MKAAHHIFVLSLIVILGAISVHPAASQSRFWQEMHKGQLNFDRGRMRQAMRHYENALAIDSTNMLAHYNFADAAMALDSINLAMEEFGKVAGTSKDRRLRYLSYHNRGVLLQAQAMQDQRQDLRNEHLRMAIDEYKRSLRLNPKSDPARYNLALCLKLLKDGGGSPDRPQPKPQEKNQDKSESKPQPKNQNDNNPPKDPRQPKQQPPARPHDQMMEYARRREQQTNKKVQGVKYARPSKMKNW